MGSSEVCKGGCKGHKASDLAFISPKLKPVSSLRHVPPLSGPHEDTQRFKFVEMSAAKFHAMKLEFLDFFSGREGHSRCNIINFGDMEYEHEAVRDWVLC